MKQVFIITALILGLSAVNSSALMQGGMMGQDTMMQGGMMGQDTMMQGGMMGQDTMQTDKGQKQTGEMYKHGSCSQMMGSGMMGRGMMGSGMMGGGHYGQGYDEKTAKPFTSDEVEIILEYYLLFNRNPNLRLGNITEKDDYFEVEIVTKERSLVNKLLVDKYTGGFRSAY